MQSQTTAPAAPTSRATLASSVASGSVPADLPAYVDRRAGAAAISRYLFPVSPKTIEEWPLATRRVNKRAMIDTADLFAFALAKIRTAPLIMGGRGPRARTRQAA